MSSETHDLDVALWTAAFHQDISEVAVLLRRGANPNSSHNGSFVLIRAILIGNIEIVKLLCENGGNPNLEDDLGNTPLFFSTNMDSDGIILKYLLDKGADLYHENIFGQTPLFGILLTPISSGVLENLKMYVDKSVVVQRGNKGETLAHMIDNIHDEIPTKARHGREGNIEPCLKCLKLLQILFDNGLDMDLPDCKGTTPLMVACDIPCYLSMETLIKTAQNIFSKNKRGETAFHALARRAGAQNFEKCCELLLQNGFEINVTDILGRTPLHHYVNSSYVNAKCIQFFIDKGAKTDQTTVFGETILHQMIEKSNRDSYKINERGESHCESIRFLVELGLDVNQSDAFGESPLHKVASDNEQVETISTLLELGANVTAGSKNGETPLHVSTMNPNICRILSEYCVKMKLGVNCLDKFGSTPLHWSLWFHERESIQILVNSSADIALKDSSGMTPVDLVEYLGLDDSFKAILKSRETTLNKDNACETGHIDDNAALSLVGESELEDDDENELEDEDFLDSDGTMVDTDAWYEKIESKTSSLKKLTSKILLSERMGLYFCLEENQAIQEVISQIIEKLTGYVSASDPVLESSVSLAGSVNEGTKVGWQNEFDYIWSLKYFNEHFVPIESPLHPEGYVKLQLPEGQPNMPGLERFLDFDRYLDAQELNYRMYLLINQGLLDMFLGKQDHDINLSCITISKLLDIKTGKLSHIGFVWTGPTMKRIMINVDIVPTIVPKAWNPQRLRIPQCTVFKHLQELPPLAVVTKYPNSRIVPKYSTFLRISYAHLERAVIRNASDAIKKGYILIKALADEYLPSVRNSYTRDEVELSTYKFKTCFLHELGEHAEEDGGGARSEMAIPEPTEITIDWANKIVNRLELSMKQRNLPSFFDRNKNILCTEGQSVLQDDSVLGYGTIVACLKKLLELSTKESTHK